jgi:hypothetical protein
MMKAILKAIAVSALFAASAASALDIQCAKENGTCIVPNPATVSYGYNGAYNVKYGVQNSISCNNATFGDPLFGVVKGCYLDMGDPAAKNWTKCADENGTCNFTGPMFVRYGAGNNWVYGSHANSVGCNNGTFGDPKYGTVKACYVAR